MTPDRRDDLEHLFGPQGASMGRWCAYWRLRHRAFAETTAEQHRCLLRARVESVTPPRLLAYRGDEPVTWVSVEPQERFEALGHARVYNPGDDTPVWTVTSFYLLEDVLGEGLTADRCEP